MYKNIIWFDELDSTQDYLKDANINSLPEWTVISTRKQAKGKGQGSNVWESEQNKNLTFSILLKPNFLSVSNQFLITQILSLGIYDFLTHYLDDVFIKWPNDIYVGKNKICGILVNNKIIADEYLSATCGIGININQTEFCFAPNATSLKKELNQDLIIENVLIEILDSIKNRYDIIKENKIADYKREYLDKLLHYNIWAKYSFNDNNIEKNIEAKIIDVDKYGRLILENRLGKTIIADIKQLKFYI